MTTKDTPLRLTEKQERLIIVGADDGSNVGGSFLRGAAALGVNAILVNHHLAFAGPPVWRKICWHFLDRRAPRQKWFSDQVGAAAQRHHAEFVLFTGQSPIDGSLLHALRKQGIRTAVYLTDDPFNPTHRCNWFLRILPKFDLVCTTRKANVADLQNLGVKRVMYVPFGVDPHLFFPPPAPSEVIQGADVFFAGGADAERARMIGALHQAGFKLELYGSYWDRYPETQGLGKGQCDVTRLREAAWRSKVGLCVVRKANRDGHCMRTFELPAMGCCMLVEDTEEHREIFGLDKWAVNYFSSIPEMVERVKGLLGDAFRRQELAKTASELIAQGEHTYADRLRMILEADSESEGMKS